MLLVERPFTIRRNGLSLLEKRPLGGNETASCYFPLGIINHATSTASSWLLLPLASTLLTAAGALSP